MYALSQSSLACLPFANSVSHTCHRTRCARRLPRLDGLRAGASGSGDGDASAHIAGDSRPARGCGAAPSRRPSSAGGPGVGRWAACGRAVAARAARAAIAPRCRRRRVRATARANRRRSPPGRCLDAVLGPPSDQGVEAAASALKVRVSQIGSRRGVAQSRTVAVTSNLCTSSPRGAGMDNVQVIVPHRFASCGECGGSGGGAVGYIAGLDADRAGQFSLGDVHHSAIATTVLPPPLLCCGPQNGIEATAGRSSISCTN